MTRTRTAAGLALVTVTLAGCAQGQSQNEVALQQSLAAVQQQLNDANQRATDAEGGLAGAQEQAAAAEARAEDAEAEVEMALDQLMTVEEELAAADDGSGPDPEVAEQMMDAGTGTTTGSDTSDIFALEDMIARALATQSGVGILFVSCSPEADLFTTVPFSCTAAADTGELATISVTPDGAGNARWEVISVIGGTPS